MDCSDLTATPSGRKKKAVMPVMTPKRDGSMPGGIMEPDTDDSTSAKMFKYPTRPPICQRPCMGRWLRF